MANIKLSTIEERLETMRRADNHWADTYVRDVSHLLKLLKDSTAPATSPTSVADLISREDAWDEHHKSLNRDGKWTAGEYGNFYAFFIAGWNARSLPAIQSTVAVEAAAKEITGPDCYNDPAGFEGVKRIIMSHLQPAAIGDTDAE